MKKQNVYCIVVDEGIFATFTTRAEAEAGIRSAVKAGALAPQWEDVTIKRRNKSHKEKDQ